MITHLRLKNFKAYIQTELALRPITILLGPNNSGKSSLLAAIRLLSQTVQSHDPTPPLLLNGIFGDFGTYRDIVFLNHRGRPIQIGLTVEPTHNPLTQSTFTSPSPVSIDLEFKYRSQRREIVLVSADLRHGNKPLLETKYSKDSERQILSKVGHYTVPTELRAPLSGYLRMQNFLPRLRLLYSERKERDSSTAAWIDERKLDPMFDMSRRAAMVLDTQLSELEYIGPFRAPPERTYSFSGERRARVGSSGQYASDIFMMDYARPKARSAISERINAWFADSEVAARIDVVPISDRHYEIRITNFSTGEKQNIADVGYGNSQILPVLIAGYNCRPGYTMIVEQPELHLHPRAQAHLAAFISQLSQNRVQTLVETHSEYLVVGLQELVAAGAIPASDIALYYVHPLGETKVPDLIELDDTARFTSQWPEGFFPERLELAKRVALARSNQGSDPQ